MEPIKNPFGDVFLDKVQSFDLKLHWSFVLIVSCGNSYNTCISFCKTLLSSYFCSQRHVQNSVWHLGWRVMQKYLDGERLLTMFAGRFVLDVWRDAEYASVAFFFEVLVVYYINNGISNNKARPQKHQKYNVFAKHFSLLFSFSIVWYQWFFYSKWLSGSSFSCGYNADR